MTQLMVLDCRQISKTPFGRRSIASVRAFVVDARALCVLGQTQHTRLKEEGRFWTSTLPLFGNLFQVGGGLSAFALTAGK